MNVDSDVAKYTAKKPHQLALKEDYVQTDIQTLKAFLLLTTDVCRGCETEDAVTLLEIQRSRGLVTLHLPTSGPMPTNTQHTKFENRSNYRGIPTILPGTI
jgi:hypothetical protein